MSQYYSEKPGKIYSKLNKDDGREEIIRLLLYEKLLIMLMKYKQYHYINEY